MEKLEVLKRSEVLDFVGEVFFEEMQDLLDNKKDNKKFWIKSHGINSRAFSKDIVDLSSYSYVVHNEIKEAIFIHISRNSIYHQLPESFFHPLVISNPTMSNEEVVEAIRENRKKEKDNILFFIPFDTKLFEKRVRLTNRYVNIFTDKNSKKVLFDLAYKIIGKEISLSQEQYYKLFLNLCDSEIYKENLPELEKLLQRILGYDVLLQYIKHSHTESPFQAIGEGIIGHTFGTHGNTICEFDNVEATMIVTEKMNFKTIKTQMSIIEKILEYFIFSNRSILIKFQTKRDSTIILGDNYLGYNTILIA
jgi:hypothetical protein